VGVRRAVIGVLPALGGGLTDLARTGQHDRLLRYDLAHYADEFDEVRYFSYFDERLEDFTADARLRAAVRLYPRRLRVGRHLYALLLPLVHRRALAECDALRVEQFTGVLPAVLARALGGVPYVVSYGYDYDAVARVRGPAWKPLYFAWLRRVAIPRAAGLILPDADLGVRLRARWPGVRALDLPNGVDAEHFAPGERAADPGGGRVVLYAGRLSVEKNLLTLVEALARVGEPDVRLVLVGDGPEAARIRARASARGVDVVLAGVVPNHAMPRHYRAADCFALPSLTEGNPKALLEAMACALPCVVSDRGGNRRLVADGETGLRVDPEDPGALAAAIGRVLRDRALAARLGKAARERVLAAYDVHRLLGAEVRFVAGCARPGR